MADLYQVHMLCNHDDGSFSGRVQAAKVLDGSGRILVTIDGDLDRPPKMRTTGLVVFVAGQAFACASEWGASPESIYWQVAWMSGIEVRRLLEVLAARRFVVEECVLGCEFYSLAESLWAARLAREAASGC